MLQVITKSDNDNSTDDHSKDNMCDRERIFSHSSKKLENTSQLCIDRQF